MSTQRERKPVTGIVIPEELRDYLKQQAAKSFRSMNQEIAKRLQDSRERDQQGAAA